MGVSRQRASSARVAFVTCVSVALFATVGWAFWREDLRYSQPTPRPLRLIQPPRGARIPLDRWLRPAGLQPGRRPVLVHFFNPDCPCSRFNLDHVRELQRRFGRAVIFVAAIQAEVESGPARRALLERLHDLDLPFPWFLDTGGRVAAEAGVYSTPQAVVVDGDGKLAYRGNYNVSRYCTDPETEFVGRALASLVDGRAAAGVPETPAYGCSLPESEDHLPRGGEPPDVRSEPETPGPWNGGGP